MFAHREEHAIAVRSRSTRYVVNIDAEVKKERTCADMIKRTQDDDIIIRTSQARAAIAGLSASSQRGGSSLKRATEIAISVATRNERLDRHALISRSMDSVASGLTSRKACRDMRRTKKYRRCLWKSAIGAFWSPSARTSCSSRSAIKTGDRERRRAATLDSPGAGGGGFSSDIPRPRHRRTFRRCTKRRSTSIRTVS